MDKLFLINSIFPIKQRTIKSKTNSKELPHHTRNLIAIKSLPIATISLEANWIFKSLINTSSFRESFPINPNAVHRNRCALVPPHSSVQTISQMGQKPSTEIVNPNHVPRNHFAKLLDLLITKRVTSDTSRRSSRANFSKFQHFCRHSGATLIHTHTFFISLFRGAKKRFLECELPDGRRGRLYE